MLGQGRREPRLVLPALLDVPDQPREEALAFCRGDQLPGRFELVGRHLCIRAERGHQAADHSVSTQHAVGQALVGQRLEQLLPVTQVDEIHVDRPVGEDPVGDLDGPSPFDLAGQQLATDRVADVMGEQPQPIDPQSLRQRHGQIGLVDQPVGTVGLGRQSEPQQVEQHHPAIARQCVDHAVEVERGRGEPVQDEQRRKIARGGGGHVDGEEALAAQRALDPPGPPVVDQSVHHWITTRSPRD